jgi:bacterioferritin-associated ferredoxin
MAIICHCHAVSDRTLRSLAAHCGSVADVQRECQAATRCGGCFEAVEQIVESAVAVRPMAAPLRLAGSSFPSSAFASSAFA